MNTTIINQGYKIAIDEHAARGKLAQWVRKQITAGKWAEVGEAYGKLETEFGKRHKDPETKEYTSSTSADSMRSAIHNVSVAMVNNPKYPEYTHKNALKPVEIEKDVWGLEVKSGEANSKPKSVPVEKVCAKFASKFKTEEQKKAALIATARAMGIEIKF